MEERADLVERSGEFNMGRVVVGKLKVGVDLHDAILDLVKKEGIHAGVFLTGLGALEKAVFRNVKWMPVDYRMKDEYRIYLEVQQPLELVSLSGWIATGKDGGAQIHAHFSASTVMEERIVTLGGHLTQGTTTSIKCVVGIGVMDDPAIFAAIDPAVNQTEIYW